MAAPTITRPPTRTYNGGGGGGGGKKIFTIHDAASANPFCMRMNRKDNVPKTTMITFAREKDAILIATMLESHKRNTNEWPHHDFTDASSSLFMIENDLFPVGLQELDIRSNKLADIQFCCYLNFIDLLVLNSITKTSNSSFNTNGEVYMSDPDQETCAEILNSLYMRYD